ADTERLNDAYNAIFVTAVRAMLRLGLGDLEGAITDQASALEHARVAKDPQALYYSLAVSVHVHADTGDLDAARERFDELVALDPAAFRHIGHALGNVTWAASIIDRDPPAQRALTIAEWPSFQAARALLAGDHTTAASIYDT